MHCPGIARAGGFTLTSSPSKALRRGSATVGCDGGGEEHEGGYFELAVARSPGNAPAAWLWQDGSSANGPGMKREAEPLPTVIGQEITVRIGGSFVWPPPGIDTGKLRKVVFVAGGVGVNPLMSMLSHLAEQQYPFEVEFLYSVKDPATAAAGNGNGERHAEEILFLERIAEIFERKEVSGRLRLFLTGPSEVDADSRDDEISCPGLGTMVTFERRRAAVGDVVSALASGQDGALDKDAAVVYICGVPGMTDEFVKRLTNPDGIGMPRNRVLCEKWW